MIRRSACFVCTTPYQIIESIAIVKELKLDADLYIYGTFKGYMNVSEKLNESNIFCNINAIDYSRYISISLTKTLWDSLNYRRIASKIISCDVSYDFFYTSTRSHTNLILLYELLRRNPQMCYVYFEDGIGTYEKDMKYLIQSKYRKYTEKLLGKNTLDPHRTIIMAMYPEMLEIPNVLNGVRIVKQPLVRFTKDFTIMMKNLFALEKFETPAKSIVFFDTFREKKSIEGLEVKMMNLCLCKVVDIFSNYSVLYKPHPRSILSPNIDFNVTKLDGNPAELFFAQLGDIDNLVLMGNLSTSLFTPKLLFNKEPLVISLHRIAIPDRHNWFSMFDKVKSMYKHKERMMAPSNIAELCEMCNSVKNLYF